MVFAPGRYRLHNGCRSQQNVAEGAGLIAQGHRQDDEHRSGVDKGIRASPAGIHPRQLAHRPNQAA
jgi:hypothetical protein